MIIQVYFNGDFTWTNLSPELGFEPTAAKEAAFPTWHLKIDRLPFSSNLSTWTNRKVILSTNRLFANSFSEALVRLSPRKLFSAKNRFQATFNRHWRKVTWHGNRSHLESWTTTDCSQRNQNSWLIGAHRVCRYSILDGMSSSLSESLFNTSDDYIFA